MTLQDWIIKMHDEFEVTAGYASSIIDVRTYWGKMPLCRCTMQNLYSKIVNEPRLANAYIVEMSILKHKELHLIREQETFPPELRSRTIYVVGGRKDPLPEPTILFFS